MKDILETLTTDGSFHTLLAMLEKADMTAALREAGPATLFAPDDKAFERVNVEELASDRDTLVSLLTYHLVDGRLSAAEVAGSDHLATHNGKSLTVQVETGEQVIDNAKFVRTDIDCTNGIIHVIDNVFLPRMSGWYCGGCC